MTNVLRVLIGLPSLLFLVVGVRWVVDTEAVAAEFGMPLLEGLGLSTQAGDLGAFFVSGGLFGLLGLYTQKREWFYAGAMLLGFTALFRTMAWMVQGAPFAVMQIGVEVVLTVLMLIAASRCKTA